MVYLGKSAAFLALTVNLKTGKAVSQLSEYVLASKQCPHNALHAAPRGPRPPWLAQWSQARASAGSIATVSTALADSARKLRA